MFGLSCYLSSLANTKDNPILHYRMVTISFYKYIAITRESHRGLTYRVWLRAPSSFSRQ